MPKGTPFTKIRRTRNFGGNVILKGETLNDAYNHVKNLVSEKKFTEIHPYNDIEIIKGQGTLCYEMLHDFNELDLLLVPVGGGGLIAGCSIVAKNMNNNILDTLLNHNLTPVLVDLNQHSIKVVRPTFKFNFMFIIGAFLFSFILLFIVSSKRRL